MLFGVTGVIRSGKTTILDLLSQIVAEDKTQEVYCNFRTKHSNIHYMASVDDFLNLEFEEMNGLAVCQEMHVWAEARLSGGREMNRFISKVILQSGKLGFDLLWDAQLASSVDKRIRFMTLNWFVTRRKILHPLTLRYIYVNELNRTFKFRLENEAVLKKYVFSDFNTRELADLKRKWEIESAQHKSDNKDNIPLVPPINADKYDSITPNQPDKVLNIEEELKGMQAKGITEIVS